MNAATETFSPAERALWLYYNNIECDDLNAKVSQGARILQENYHYAPYHANHTAARILCDVESVGHNAWLDVSNSTSTMAVVVVDGHRYVLTVANLKKAIADQYPEAPVDGRRDLP